MIWEIVGSILFSLVAAEIYASCPWLTTALLKRAKRALPEEYQDRYWEEWLGELDAQQDFGNLRKLGWALGVFLSSWKTGRTLQSAIEQAKRSGIPDQQQERGRTSYVSSTFTVTKEDLEMMESEWLRLQSEDEKLPGNVKSSRVLWPWPRPSKGEFPEGTQPMGGNVRAGGH